MNLILSPKADWDLEEAAIYPGRHSARASFRFVNAVERTLGLIASMPEIAPTLRPQPARLRGLRKFGVMGFPRYLIFYRIEPDHVAIVRVLHAAQDVRSILEGE